jgi:P-loop Domain of unknown function (DUF2791)
VISPQRRSEIIGALSRGSVPERGLENFAVGTARFAEAIDDQLAEVGAGSGSFKAIRGDYGSGKTFTVRWLADRARRTGFATSEVQISEGETPLHHLETVYRRIVERLATGDEPHGALRTIVDAWFYALDEDVIASGSVDAADASALALATDQLAERRLAGVAGRAPAFAAALRGYRRALAEGEASIAEGLLAWISGQPNVAASVKRFAGIKGELDHTAALAFLAGLLTVLRDAGYSGLVVVLDEVETLQRVRSDIRERSLNALRQLIDEVDGGRYPGLLLVITGTPAFFDGSQGAQRTPPLAQRLHTDFTADARFDNPRAIQLRLLGLSIDGLCEVAQRVRELYADGAKDPERVRRLADDAYVRDLAVAITGNLGGKVGIAPRLFLKKLVDVLQRIDAFPDFDPRRDYVITVVPSEMTAVEQNAHAGMSVDDIALDLDLNES